MKTINKYMALAMAVLSATLPAHALEYEWKGLLCSNLGRA